MALRLRSVRPSRISPGFISKPRILPLRPSPTWLQRSYARYSRFGDDEGGNRGRNPNEPDENDFNKRGVELFRQYGAAAALAGVGTLWYVSHLEQVPETQRWRYMDVSKKMREVLEEQSYAQLMSEWGQSILPINHRATQLVQTVAEKLITQNGLGHVVTRSINSNADQKPDEWLVYVVDQDIKNAFVMPGRKIVVFSGMLRQVQNVDQLAGILGHEVAHQLVGHVLERLSLTRMLVFLDFAIQFLLGTNTNLSGIVLQALIALPHSRTQELEADLIGLRLMSKACFDPNAVVSFWQSFDKEDKLQTPQFISTHPGHKQRAKAIEGWIPAVRSEYPCVEMVDFAQAYQQQTVRDQPSTRFLEPAQPARTPGHRSRTPQRTSPTASPPASPDGSNWGAHDPWATGSSDPNSRPGDASDWGARDPWAERNGGKKNGSW